MATHSMTLITVNLPKNITRQMIESRLGVTLKPGIESARYSDEGGRFILFTSFNVLTLIDTTREAIVETLQTLGLNGAEAFEKSHIFQDYPLIIENDLLVPVKVNNDTIILKEYAPLYLGIIALVISQSVGLEQYEDDLEQLFAQSRNIIDTFHTYSIFRRANLVRFVRKLSLMRHDMVHTLILLDKPNIVWDNTDAEGLYNDLAGLLEIKERFDVVEYKLALLRDDTTMVMDLITHKQSEFLEWIIILLILVEIIMGLVEWFFPSLIP